MTLQQALNEWSKTIPMTHCYPPSLFVPGTISLGPPPRIKNPQGQAFKTPSHYDGDCPCIGGSASHMKQTWEEKDINGHKMKLIKFVPKKDKEVCERERAWRNYISIRDGKNYKIV